MPDHDADAEEILMQMIAASLRVYRKRRDISQMELVKELELSPAYDGSIERGQQNFQFSTVCRIADAIAPLELLSGTTPED